MRSEPMAETQQGQVFTPQRRVPSTAPRRGVQVSDLHVHSQCPNSGPPPPPGFIHRPTVATHMALGAALAKSWAMKPADPKEIYTPLGLIYLWPIVQDMGFPLPRQKVRPRPLRPARPWSLYMAGQRHSPCCPSEGVSWPPATGREPGVLMAILVALRGTFLGTWGRNRGFGVSPGTPRPLSPPLPGLLPYLWLI